MTFLAEETSVESGAPFELYEFRVGPDQFNFTSAEDELDLAGTVYTPAEISRTKIDIGPEQRAQIVSVTLPSDNAFAKKYINIVPGSQATLTIKRLHRFDVSQETIVIFKGVVRSAAFSLEGAQATIAVLPLTAGLGRTAPRFLYSGICNHVHYDDKCKVDETTFRFIGTISAISGNVYTIPGLAGSAADPTSSNQATGGFCKFGSLDFRLILQQNTDDVTLLLPFDATLVPVGASLDVFAGCDHSIQICKTQYDNVVNYGGYAFVPLRNIFATGLD